MDSCLMVRDGKLHIRLTGRHPFHEETAGQDPSREEIWQALQQLDLNAYRQIVFGGGGEPMYRLEDMLWLCGKIREKSPVDLRLDTTGLGDLLRGEKTAFQLEQYFQVVAIYLPVEEQSVTDEQRKAIRQFAVAVGLFVPKVYLVVPQSSTKEKKKACQQLCLQTGARYREEDWAS